jgi:Cd2+/Zn2+-exporting ATPase
MPVAQLQAGVLVLVRPGDKVPVDGTIEAGTSVLDESMVTGESKPVTKSVGQAVLAGTVNSGSTALRVRATAAAGDSTVARLATLMEAAAASKSRHDMAVEAFAKYYTPLVVLVALLTVGLGAVLQPAAWRHWAYLSLVVLVTGCPCALVISTPVASVAGLTRAARRVSGLIQRISSANACRKRVCCGS